MSKTFHKVCGQNNNVKIKCSSHTQIENLLLEGFISFLENNWETLCGTRQQGPPDGKGKKPVGSVPRTVMEIVGAYQHHYWETAMTPADANLGVAGIS